MYRDVGRCVFVLITYVYVDNINKNIILSGLVPIIFYGRKLVRRIKVLCHTKHLASRF